MIKIYENFITDLFDKKKSNSLPGKGSGKLTRLMHSIYEYDYDTVYPSLKKQYWAEDYYSKRLKEHHWLIIKFLEEEISQVYKTKKSRKYKFNGIFKNLENTEIIPLSIEKNNWIIWQEKGIIREATPEEIEHYNFYENTNKYNL
jgi:hypothetical protein